MNRWDRLQSTASSQRWQPGPACRAPSDKSHWQVPSSGPGELPVALRGSQARHHLTWRASCSTAGTSGAQPSGREPIVQVCWVPGATPPCTCLFVLSAPPAALSVLPVSRPSRPLHPGLCTLLRHPWDSLCNHCGTSGTVSVVPRCHLTSHR